MINKISTLIMLIGILSFVGAQVDCQPANGTDIFNTQIKPKLDNFFSDAPNAVTTAKKTDVENAGKDLANKLADLMNGVNGVTSPVPASQILTKVNDYFSGANVEIDGMLALVNGMTNPTPSPASKTEAAEDYFTTASDFNKFFFQDMKNAPDQFTQAEYMKDFERLGKSAENFLVSENTPVQTNSTSIFDAKQFLDRALVSPENKKLTFEISGFGVDNRFSPESIKALISKFRGTFAGDSEFLNNIDFFLNSFPQSAAQVIQDGSTPNPTVFDQLSGLGNLFEVNAFGLLELNGVSASNAPIVASSIDARFNARQFTSFTDGIHPQIRLTVNDRKFELVDEVFTSPIVFDLDGDSRLEACNGNWLPHKFNQKSSSIKEFDLDGDGFTEFVEWVGVNDGLLIAYNPNAELNGLQLMGEPGGFFDGYHKLSSLDQNNDKNLTGEELKTLSIWQDKNSNAKVDAGEILSLADLKITSVGVTHTNFESTFTQNGEVKKAWDYYPCVLRVKRKE